MFITGMATELANWDNSKYIIAQKTTFSSHLSQLPAT